LRSARYGRCDKAPKLHAWLEWIARDLIDDNARHTLLQSVGDIRGPHPIDLIGINDIDACRHLFDVNA
jgi:hypothetical protein